eukprot:768813-Hanusia_phi.AAC.1
MHEALGGGGRGAAAEAGGEIAPITLSSHRLPPPPLPFAAVGSSEEEGHTVGPAASSKAGKDIDEALEQLEWTHPPSLCVGKRQRDQAEFHEKNMKELLGYALPVHAPLPSLPPSLPSRPSLPPSLPSRPSLHLSFSRLCSIPHSSLPLPSSLCDMHRQVLVRALLGVYQHSQGCNEVFGTQAARSETSCSYAGARKRLNLLQIMRRACVEELKMTETSSSKQKVAKEGEVAPLEIREDACYVSSCQFV